MNKSNSTTTTEKRKSGRPRKEDSAKSAAAPRKSPQARRHPGKPLLPPEAKAEAIKVTLSLIADGLTLTEIEKKTGINRQTLNDWMTDNTGSVAVTYARNREARADRIAREIFEIADNAPDDNPAAVNKARLQVDARKWYLSKILPEKYGDLQRVELSGRNGGAIGIAAAGVVAIDEVRRMRDMLFDAIETPLAPEEKSTV